MGAVKRDIKKNEHKFKQVSFSDVNCIKGLIRHRSMIDDYYNFESEELRDVQEIHFIIAEKEFNLKNEERFNELKEQGKIPESKKFTKLPLHRTSEFKDDWNKRISASEINETNQELIALYVDLDRLIEQASLTRKHQIILELLMCGLNENDIAFYFKQKKNRIVEMFDTICKKLKKDYDRQWKYSLADQDLIKVEWSYKECSNCKKSLPLTEDYFYKKADNKDGFHNSCRKCSKS